MKALSNLFIIKFRSNIFDGILFSASQTVSRYFSISLYSLNILDVAFSSYLFYLLWLVLFTRKGVEWGVRFYKYEHRSIEPSPGLFFFFFS